MATEGNDALVPLRTASASEGAVEAGDASHGKGGVRASIPRVVTSESLLNGATQLAILHDRTLYYLRQTRYGKLILTK